MTCLKGLISIVLAGVVCACTTATLIEPACVPSTERVVTAEGNRVFFVGGSSLYELLSKPDGTYDTAATMTREDCMLIGLVAAGATLYMTCAAFGAPTPEQQAAGFPPTVRTDLIRLDLRKSPSDPARVAVTALEGPGFFPNGMAMDKAGYIYISNSYSAVASLLSMETHPAVIRVRVLNRKRFQIESTPVLSANDGGSFPNGLQIRDNRLWLVSANTMYEMEIAQSALENARMIYTIPPSRMMDDFAVLPNDILAVAEIPMPGYAADASDAAKSRLTYLRVGAAGEPDANAEIIWEQTFDAPIAPSSAASVMDDEGPALYVTDYFSGGLYRVGF